MTCWVLLPVKPPGLGKTRLAGILSPIERNALVAAMLARAVREAGAAAGVDHVAVVGSDRHGLPEDLTLIPDPGTGLDAAAAAAVRAADGRAERLVLLSPDLPRVTADEIAQLAALPARDIGIAPDRAGQGTNALSLPLPAARMFAFGYGPGSFARHVAAAERLALAARRVVAPGLAFDLDTQEDLSKLG